MVLSFLGYHVCKAFVEGCCLPSHATRCRENQRGEYTTLNFPDLLSIFSLLGLFVSPVNRWGVCWMVGGCVPKPLAWMSTWVPSPVFAEWAVILSLLSGWSGGPVRSEAVMSRISLWQMVGKHPMWQIMAWSTVNWAPQLQVWENYLASIHSAGIVHPWTLFCGGRNHVLWVGGWRATRRSRSLWRVPHITWALG